MRAPEQQLRMAHAIGDLHKEIRQAIRTSIPDATDEQCQNASLSVMMAMTEAGGLVFGLPEEVKDGPA
jgi:hypothetical protein